MEDCHKCPHYIPADMELSSPNGCSYDGPLWEPDLCNYDPEWPEQ